jgi:hypothetical protein
MNAGVYGVAELAMGMRTNIPRPLQPVQMREYSSPVPAQSGHISRGVADCLGAPVLW